MHPEAQDGLKRLVERSGINTHGKLSILDIGGADINGTVHGLFPYAHFDVVDREKGYGVTIVADAVKWKPRKTYDVVLCTETFEHCEKWPMLVFNAALAMRPDSHLFLSCASTGRRPHGARGGQDPKEDEWYGNVEPTDLVEHLSTHFEKVVVEYRFPPGDLYAWTTKLWGHDPEEDAQEDMTQVFPAVTG